MQDVQIVQLVQVASGLSGPGGPGGPVGQAGPGDQVCQCIWFPWSKQSNYRDNLRCHACD